MELRSLIQKYSGPGPRYTSYPTAPQWSEDVASTAYAEQLGKKLRQNRNVALYVHIPYCESLCYYCGCNIQITHDHGKSAPYVEALSKEIALVSDLLLEPILLDQISFGGGTPTFLTVSELSQLWASITHAFKIAPGAEISIEVDPRVTSDGQLEALRGFGFNRISLGVQDFNPEVQKAINRVQSAEMTEQMLKTCRQLGYQGINFDLIYGLPLQSVESFSRTLDAIVAIGPDRIALYNYARLPSMIKHQTILEKYPMPSAEERVEIFLLALEKLQAAGYIAIGMDHFAKSTDELALAVPKGTLYRNFMGYTVRNGTDMLGVGASAIGEVNNCFFQNIKKVSDYESAVQRGGLATAKGMRLSTDDIQRKWIIQSLMCQFRLRPEDFKAAFGEDLRALYARELEQLEPFVQDGILKRDLNAYTVTEMGRLFVRNVAMVFDAYLARERKATFSQTV